MKNKINNSSIDKILDAVIALYVAGSPISFEDIKSLLGNAEIQADKSIEDVLLYLVEAIDKECSRLYKEEGVDLETLQQCKLQLEKLMSLLDKGDMKTKLKLNSENTGDSKVCKGCYIYGIVSCSDAVKFGPIGVEGNEVYTIPYRDLCALVHECNAEAYSSADDEKVKEWVQSHQNVLDEAKKRFDVVIPMTFDMILKVPDMSTHKVVVQDWLKAEYDKFLSITEKIRGKDEYGIQIFYDYEIMKSKVLGGDEIQRVNHEIATKPRGIAYMYRQKLENMVKAEIEKLTCEFFEKFYEQIKNFCDDIKCEKTRKVEKGKEMLMNLSCLVSRDNIDSLGEELDKINSIEGFSVRFTGPWPPYSFVSEEK